jgi:hypothetical protein
MNLCTHASSMVVIYYLFSALAGGIVGYLIALFVRRPDRCFVVTGGPAGRMLLVDDTSSQVKIGGDLSRVRRVVLAHGDRELGTEEWDAGTNPESLDVWLQLRGMRA